ncbi:hypothetical protein JKP88DRAFT_243768 [Tribonema minus]|uniref:Uncharacterized protein n=1 Tax=Tribonema minus TaxID=303371 RepID=A0A835ZE22_9STRA|nr:hypothetical protein JKP88DRAFT_243768 [Tribonema minus]
MPQAAAPSPLQETMFNTRSLISCTATRFSFTRRAARITLTAPSPFSLSLFMRSRASAAIARSAASPTGTMYCPANACSATMMTSHALASSSLLWFSGVHAKAATTYAPREASTGDVGCSIMAATTALQAPAAASVSRHSAPPRQRPHDRQHDELDLLRVQVRCERGTERFGGARRQQRRATAIIRTELLDGERTADLDLVLVDLGGHGAQHGAAVGAQRARGCLGPAQGPLARGGLRSLCVVCACSAASASATAPMSPRPSAMSCHRWLAPLRRAASLSSLGVLCGSLALRMQRLKGAADAGRKLRLHVAAEHGRHQRARRHHAVVLLRELANRGELRVAADRRLANPPLLQLLEAAAQAGRKLLQRVVAQHGRQQRDRIHLLVVVPRLVVNRGDLLRAAVRRDAGPPTLQVLAARRTAARHPRRSPSAFVPGLYGFITARLAETWDSAATVARKGLDRAGQGQLSGHGGVEPMNEDDASETSVANEEDEEESAVEADERTGCKRHRFYWRRRQQRRQGQPRRRVQGQR